MGEPINRLESKSTVSRMQLSRSLGRRVFIKGSLIPLRGGRSPSERSIRSRIFFNDRERG